MEHFSGRVLAKRRSRNMWEARGRRGQAAPRAIALQTYGTSRKESMKDEVQDDQYDQRNAKKPAEKIRHDVISFRIEV
jgi:hypothetical protein